MSKNKLLKLASILLILSMFLVGCGQAEEEVVANPMNYLPIEDLQASINQGSDQYIMLDVRKVEDHNEGHIKGAYMADIDAAAKGGDDAAGTASLKKALLEATGSETGRQGDKYVLLCYSGKTYAQKGTDLLIEMGVGKDQIYTLEGGTKAWAEGGSEYTDLIE